jgi:hypothetical protein
MDDGERELLKRALDALEAHGESLYELHGVVSRIGERMNATFIAIHDRQRRSSDNFQALREDFDGFRNEAMGAVATVDKKADALHADTSKKLAALALHLKVISAWAAGAFAVVVFAYARNPDAFFAILTGGK